MRKNNQKFNSIVIKLLVPMLILALLQGGIFFCVFYFTSSFVLGLLCSVLLSSAAIAVYSFYIANPVKRMSEKIKNNKSFDANDIGRTNIYEIDVLIDEIQSLTENVADSALRLERIIELAKMPIGAYEYSEGDSKVFCTGRMHWLLNFSDKISMSGFISSEVFFDKMNGIQKFIFSSKDDDSEIVYRFTDENDNRRWTRLYVTKTGKSILGVAADITAEYNEKRMLEHERDHDSMTQLLNRRAFYNSAYEIFKEPENMRVAAVIMLDIDNLKYVNDTYGHDKGDKYIIAAAKSLEKTCNEYTDKAIISRLAGDEFSIILYGANKKEEIRQIAVQILENISNTKITVAIGVEMLLRVSIGLSWYPDDSLTFNKLLKFADYAMYQVKNSTKGQLAEFDYHKYNKEMLAMQENEEFREILAKRKIEFKFQPVFSAKNNALFAYDIQYYGGLNFYKNQKDLIDAAINASLQYKVEDMVWTKFFEMIDVNAESFNGAKVMFYSLGDCIISERRLKDISHNKKYIINTIIYSEYANNDILQLKRDWLAQYGGSIALNVKPDTKHFAQELKLNPDYVRLSAVLYQEISSDPEKLLAIKIKLEEFRKLGTKIIAYDILTEEQKQAMIGLGADYLQGDHICQASVTPLLIESGDNEK